MAEQGWADFIRQNQHARSAVRKSFLLTAERFDKIKNYQHTRRIKYPEYKDAFDYVATLYPNVNVKQAFVYYTPKHFLNEVGYSGVGGFYDTTAKVVVITDFLGDEDYNYNEFKITAEFTMDEVLVHELIHFCANDKLPSAGRTVEEEIAYGKSIGYLRSRGRTDDFIIQKNMMPYLISAVDKADVYRRVLIRHFDEGLLASASLGAIDKLLEPLGDEIFRESKAAATRLGHQMMSAYGGVVVEEKISHRRNLIIDDDVDV